MFEVYRNDISITRGDSAIFDVTITDKLKNIYTPDSTDEIIFTVKENTRSRPSVFQKPVINGQVVIEPADTNGLCYGKYIYDVQLRKADGWVDTIIPPHAFNVLGEVSF